MKILLSNDDGLDSPALVPTLNMLRTVGQVNTVIPRYQQSWTSKANTRNDKRISIEKHDREGYEVLTLDALPADCSNYGIYLGEKPDLVVSGANVGHNLGLSAMFSSGTVGAALEGVLAKIPSVALSVPYNPDSELTSPQFQDSLTEVEKLIKIFYNSRPKNVGLIMLNLPLGQKRKQLTATSIGDYHYGALFDTHEGFATPRIYPKLKYPKKDSLKEGTDVWARYQGLTSVSFMTFEGTMVDNQVTQRWLEKHELTELGH